MEAAGEPAAAGAEVGTALDAAEDDAADVEVLLHAASASRAAREAAVKPTVRERTVQGDR